jgi:uncharacterized protein YgbK (DUF1537 family)
MDSELYPEASRMSTAALCWYDTLPIDSAALIYSSVPPDVLQAIQGRLGSEFASALFETAAGEVARGLVDRGVTKLITAGGETSGAVIEELGLITVEVGPDATAGVPWIYDRNRALSLALKSGNFGERDFFVSVLTEDEG